GQGAEKVRAIKSVREVGKSAAAAKPGQAPAIVFETSARAFLDNDTLHEELFGPATLIVSCGSAQELETIARNLPGQLTATIHGTEEDLQNHRALVSVLEQKAGRLL